MFSELATLLRKGDTLAITVTRLDENQLRLTVTPKLFTLDGEKGPDHKVLNTPLSIDGTPAELDSPEFVATLNRFTTSATGLRQTIDEVEAVHRAAGEAKKAKAAAPAKKDEPEDKKPEPRKPSPTPQAATPTIL